MFSSLRNTLGLGPLVLMAACQTTPPTLVGAPASPPLATPAASLRNTRWVLRTLNGQPVALLNSEPYLLLRDSTLRVEGYAGCNRFFVSYQQPAAGQLRFGVLATTRRGCVDAPRTAIETVFLAALTTTRTYQISGDTLQLFGEAATQPTAVLHAVYLR